MDAFSLKTLLFQVKSLAEPKSIGGVAIPGSTLVKLLVRWTGRINSASKHSRISDAAQDLLGMCQWGSPALDESISYLDCSKMNLMDVHFLTS